MERISLNQVCPPAAFHCFLEWLPQMDVNRLEIKRDEYNTELLEKALRKNTSLEKVITAECDCDTEYFARGNLDMKEEYDNVLKVLYTFQTDGHVKMKPLHAYLFAASNEAKTRFLASCRRLDYNGEAPSKVYSIRDKVMTTRFPGNSIDSSFSAGLGSVEKEIALPKNFTSEQITLDKQVAVQVVRQLPSYVTSHDPSSQTRTIFPVTLFKLDKKLIQVGLLLASQETTNNLYVIEFERFKSEIKLLQQELNTLTKSLEINVVVLLPEEEDVNIFAALLESRLNISKDRFIIIDGNVYIAQKFGKIFERCQIQQDTYKFRELAFLKEAQVRFGKWCLFQHLELVSKEYMVELEVLLEKAKRGGIILLLESKQISETLVVFDCNSLFSLLDKLKDFASTTHFWTIEELQKELNLHQKDAFVLQKVVEWLRKNNIIFTLPNGNNAWPYLLPDFDLEEQNRRLKREVVMLSKNVADDNAHLMFSTLLCSFLTQEVGQVEILDDNMARNFAVVNVGPKDYFILRINNQSHMIELLVDEHSRMKGDVISKFRWLTKNA